MDSDHAAHKIFKETATAIAMPVVFDSRRIRDARESSLHCEVKFMSQSHRKSSRLDPYA